MKFVKKVYNVFIHLSIVIWIKQIFVTIKNSIGEIIDTSNNFIYNLIVIFLLPINFLIMLIEYLHEKVKKSGKRLIEKIVHLISLFIKAIFIIPIEFISNFIMGIKSISDRIRHNIKRRKVSKIAEKYAKLLKNCIILNGTIFFNSSFHYFTIVTTCSLQFISFFTTYSGTKYYFGNIIPFFPELAPFIITFMIQGSLVLLSNAMTIRDRINFKKIIALIGMCLISMFFSYTGIINYQIPPSKEMKRNYEDFYNKYENISNLYSSKHYGSVSEYIDKNCNSLETDAEQLSEDLKRLYNEMPTDISTAVSVSDNRTTTTSRIKNEKNLN